MAVEAYREPIEPEDQPRRAVYVPFATIGKLLLAAFLIWVVFKIWTIVTLMLVAVVLAITFEPLVVWLERARVPRWLGSVLIVLLVLALLVGFLVLSGASLSNQGRQVLERLVDAQEAAAHRLPRPLARIVLGNTNATPDPSAI